MGIYDREYYRNEGPSFLGSLATRGHVCKWLVGINAVVFIIQVMTRPQDPFLRGLNLGDGWFTNLFILDVSQVLNGQVWRLLTYAFLHADLMHILFNMLFLYWFGRDIEEMYGPREFLAFYLVAAVVGGVTFVGESLMLRSEFAGMARCLGASGAVTAVMVLYSCHFPRQIIYLFGVVPLPVWLLVGFMVAKDFLEFLGGSPGRTAVTVHLSGAVFSFVYWSAHWRILSMLPSFPGRLSQRSRSRPNLRVYREEEAPRPTPVTAPPVEESDELFDARVDALLEKIQRSGKSSLTDSERAFMDRASEVYKRRRS